MNELQEQVRKATQILKKGGIIAFPTDTVYGLGADAFNPKAIERIYEVKKRPRLLSFPLLLADISQISTVAEQIPELAWFLARYFWPGGLTLLLPKAALLPSYVTSQSTIAVRVPNHAIPLALIQNLGNPIIGTSANISGKPSILTADEVKQQLGDKIDLIIDGGKCPGGSESTIVEVTGEVPTILRQGIISAHEIDKAYKEYCEAKSHAYCSRL